MDKILLTLFLFLIMSLAQAIELTTDADAVVEFTQSGQKQSLPAGQSTTLQVDEPLWMTSPEKIPVLLVPFKSTAHVKVTTTQATVAQCDFNRSETKQLLESRMSKMLIDIFEVQKLIRLNKGAEAQAALTKLLNENAQVASLQFLAASLDVLSGQQLQALEKVKRGLKSHPEYEDGQLMLKALSGKAQ